MQRPRLRSKCDRVVLWRLVLRRGVGALESLVHHLRGLPVHSVHVLLIPATVHLPELQPGAKGPVPVNVSQTQLPHPGPEAAEQQNTPSSAKWHKWQ